MFKVASNIIYPYLQMHIVWGKKKHFAFLEQITLCRQDNLIREMLLSGRSSPQGKACPVPYHWADIKQVFKCKPFNSNINETLQHWNP